MKKLWLGLLTLIIICATLGELIRLPIATANGLLPNDLLVPLTVGSWLFYKTFSERCWPRQALWAPFLTFSSIALLSLLHASLDLSLGEIAKSGLYWIRFVSYFFLLLITTDVARDTHYRKRLGQILIGGSVVLALFGFIQLALFPDFREMQNLGWDPHIGRLLSTWFDPNFVGGLFAVATSVVAAQWLNTSSTKKRIQLTSLGLILLMALFLTYSRSAYLTAIASLGLLGLIRSPKLILAGALASLTLITVSPRAQERVTDMWHSAQSLIQEDTATLPDATARLRIESWQNAWVIIEDHPVLGVGYNTYAFVQKDYGFVKRLEKHSSTGSDSSILTIWATTGTIGLLAYLWLLGTLFWTLWTNKKHNAFALGSFTGLTGLLIHSIFVNSLLFSPLLVFLYPMIGLGLTASPLDKKPQIS
jgi:O-antigen ligase